VRDTTSRGIRGQGSVLGIAVLIVEVAKLVSSVTSGYELKVYENSTTSTTYRLFAFHREGTIASGDGFLID
jgi:hypothetical protein